MRLNLAPLSGELSDRVAEYACTQGFPEDAVNEWSLRPVVKSALVSGQEEDPRIGIDFVGSPRELYTGHYGHSEVGDDEVEGLDFQSTGRFGRAAIRFRFVAEMPEGRGMCLQYGQFVVHQKNT